MIFKTIKDIKYSSWSYSIYLSETWNEFWSECWKTHRYWSKSECWKTHGYWSKNWNKQI